MKYFSAFSGIGGFELAIHRVFEDAQCVGYSEVDESALLVYRTRYPDHPCIGDIRAVEDTDSFDLMVAGFPCRDLTIAHKHNAGLKGPQSGLFFKAVKLLEAKKPKHFLFENVAFMRKDQREIITQTLGVEPVQLNASGFWPQQRKRLYWANFPILPAVTPPKQRLIDLLDASPDSSLKLTDTALAYMDRKVKDGRNHWGFNHHHDSDWDASRCLSANLHRGIPYNVLIDRRFDPPMIRHFSRVECERLMGFPEGWTDCIPLNKAYKALGNSVVVPVIAHLLRGLEATL